MKRRPNHPVAQNVIGMRFGQLKKNIPPVSQKMLTQQLRELELDGIVSRTVYPEVPPRVDYALTALGKSLSPVIEMLYRWGENYLESRIGNQSANAINMT